MKYSESTFFKNKLLKIRLDNDALYYSSYLTSIKNQIKHSKCNLKNYEELIENLNNKLPLQNNILIYGNEPLLNSNIGNIINHINKTKKEIKIIIETDSKIFSDNKKIDELIYKKIIGKNTIISSYLDLKNNDSDKDFLVGIKNILSANLNVEINLILSNYSINKIISIVKYISKHKKENLIGIRLIFPQKDNTKNTNIPEINESFEYISKIIETIKFNNIKILKNTLPFNIDKDKELITDNYNIRLEKNYSDKNILNCSIVIPTYERTEYLEKTLLAIENLNYSKKLFEVIVVDDGSISNSNEILIKNIKVNFAIKYIYWPRTIKFSSGDAVNRSGPCRNIGAINSNSDIIIFVDSDIIVNKDFITEHLKSHKDNDVVIAPSIREIEQFDSRDKYFLYLNDKIENTCFSWIFAHEGNISFKKKDFFKVNGFDDDYIYWAVEGDDIMLKLLEEGKNIKLNRKAYGIHLSHPSESVGKESYIRNILYNGDILYKKHLNKSIAQRYFTSHINESKKLNECIKNPNKFNNELSHLTNCIEVNKCDDFPICLCNPEKILLLLKTISKNSGFFFFRDDDVDELTPNLEKLINLFVKYNVPISLQLIPTKLTKQCIDFLKNIKKNNTDIIELCQHGYSHDDYSYQNTSIKNFDHSYEFGDNILQKDQYKLIKKGRSILNSYFGELISDVFTPPFHGYNKETLNALKDNSIKIISSFSNGDNKEIDNKEIDNKEITFIDCNIDPVNDYNHNLFLNPKIIIDQMIEKTSEDKFVGFLLHHKLLNSSQFLFIESLLKLIKDYNIDSYNITQVNETLSQKENKKNNFEQRLLDHNLKNINPKLGPDLVLLDITNKCNFKCLYCSEHSPLNANLPTKEWYNKEIDFDIFKKNIDDAKKLNTKRIILGGYGEPSLHSKFHEIINYIIKNDLSIILLTNASKLNDEFIDKYYNNDIELMINTSAYNKEIYTHIHQADYSNFLNLFRFAKQLERKNPLNLENKLRINILNILNKTNYNKIYEMIALWKNINIFMITFSLIDPIEPITEKNKTILLEKDDLEVIKKQMLNIDESINNNKNDFTIINFEFLPILDFNINENKNNLNNNINLKYQKLCNYTKGFYSNNNCYQPYFFTRLWLDGAGICCERKIINKQITLEKAWLSEDFKKERLNVLNKKDKLPECMDCCHYRENYNIGKYKMDLKKCLTK
jgi:MoaA/NifB/PqqE/SkfB family radical SAM enzyme